MLYGAERSFHLQGGEIKVSYQNTTRLLKPDHDMKHRHISIIMAKTFGNILCKIKRSPHLYPEDGGSMVLRNVGILTHHYAAAVKTWNLVTCGWFIVSWY